LRIWKKAQKGIEAAPKARKSTGEERSPEATPR
jgi:hypothetical protein